MLFFSFQGYIYSLPVYLTANNIVNFIWMRYETQFLIWHFFYTERFKCSVVCTALRIISHFTHWSSTPINPFSLFSYSCISFDVYPFLFKRDFIKENPQFRALISLYVYSRFVATFMRNSISSAFRSVVAFHLVVNPQTRVMIKQMRRARFTANS